MGDTAVGEALQLRQLGPGRITMLPTTSIEFSAALTRASEGLDEAGTAWVKSQLAEIEAVLQGIEGATSTALPPPTPPPRGLIRAAEGRLLAEAAAGRIDKETASTLILPWQSATVTR